MQRPVLKTWLLALLTACVFLTLSAQEHGVSLTALINKLDRQSVVLTGRVQNQPQPFTSGRGWQCLLKTRRIQCQGRTWTMAKQVKLTAFVSEPSPLQPGSEIRLKGLFTRQAGPSNPGEFDFARHQLRQGVMGQVMINRSGLLVVLKEPGPWHWMTWLGHGYRYAQKMVDEIAPAQARPWLRALLLGNRRDLPLLDQQIMAISGLAHILAISGLHLGMMFAALTMGLGLLRLPRLWRFLIALVMVVGFTCLIGAPFSALRAIVMLGCGVLWWLHLGPKDGWSAWALALLLLLGLHPLAVMNAGLQLSFAATAAILAIWPKLPKIKYSWLRWPVHLTIVSAGIFGLTSGLMILHFNLLAPVAMVGNLVIMPLLTVTLLAGWGMLLLAGWCAAPAVFLGQVASQAVGAIKAVALTGAMVPFGHFYVPTPPAGLMVSGYGLLLIFLVYQPKLKLQAALLGGWILGALVIIGWPHPIAAVRLTALALQRGEAIVIEYHHRVILVDCGTEKDFFYQVYPFLKQRGIKRIDALLLSHRDWDHSGGAQACLQLFRVAHCLAAGHWVQQKPALTSLLASRHTQLHIMSAGEKWNPGRDWTLHSLWPLPGERRSDNLGCLVVTMTLAGRQLLFTGDSPGQVEACWQQVPACFLLKAGHHGDDRATSVQLLTRAAPQMVLVCAGTKNPYGLPDKSTLERIHKYQAVLLNSKRHGAVEVSWDKDQEPHWHFWQ